MTEQLRHVKPDENERADRPSLLARVLMAAIRFYRRDISPRRAPCCRFVPTCSQYALEAVGRHGALKGGAMALGRLLRCNPLFKGGYDPVPQKRSGRDAVCRSHEQDRCFERKARTHS